jgi:AraC-like DNA-binding protein
VRFSFSTKGWHGHTFEEFCDIASQMNFSGIELHNINNSLFADKDGAFYNYAAASTVRRLYEKKLSIPCIDAICNPSELTEKEACIKEIRKCMEIASNLHIPNIRLRANDAENEDEAVANTAAVIVELLPEAESRGVTLLMETAGLFSKTEKLRALLDSFASDYFASLWNFSAAYFGGGETPEQIIKNLIETVVLSLNLRRDENEKTASTGAGDRFSGIAGYMKAHVCDPLDVDRICAECSIGRSALKELFRRYTGSGVIKYYNYLRIRHVIKLLGEGMLMSEIAETMNF